MTIKRRLCPYDYPISSMEHISIVHIIAILSFWCFWTISKNLKKLFHIKNTDTIADWPKSAPFMAISRCQITLKLFQQYQSYQKIMSNNRTIAQSYNSHGSAFFCPLVYRNFPTNKIVPNHQGSHFQKYQKNNKSINKRNCKIIETSFTFKCSSSDIQYTSSCVIGAKCVIGALFIRPMVPR